MPSFDSSTWANFKQQFLSVIEWLLYCFDLIFDSFRAHPLLYSLAFFPIFAFAFIVIFDFITHVIPFKGLLQGTDSVSSNTNLKEMKSSFSSLKASKSVNLANSMNGRGVSSTLSDKVSTSKPLGLGSTNSTGLGSTNSTGLGSTNSTGLGSSGGVVSLGKSIADKVKKNKSDKERNQNTQDKNFNTVVDLYYSTDDDGNSVTNRVVTNTRTGEVLSSTSTVRHTSDN